MGNRKPLLSCPGLGQRTLQSLLPLAKWQFESGDTDPTNCAAAATTVGDDSAECSSSTADGTLSTLDNTDAENVSETGPVMQSVECISELVPADIGAA